MPYLPKRQVCSSCAHPLESFATWLAVCEECDEEWHRKQDEVLMEHPMAGRDSPMWLVYPRQEETQ